MTGSGFHHRQPRRQTSSPIDPHTWLPTTSRSSATTSSVKQRARNLRRRILLLPLGFGLQPLSAMHSFVGDDVFNFFLSTSCSCSRRMTLKWRGCGQHVEGDPLEAIEVFEGTRDPGGGFVVLFVQCQDGRAQGEHQLKKLVSRVC